MVKTYSKSMKKIALILVALICVACSDAKDKYISLQCLDEEANTEFNIILNKETMTFDVYATRRSQVMSTVILSSLFFLS
jgi:hypothetical protein